MSFSAIVRCHKKKEKVMQRSRMRLQCGKEVVMGKGYYDFGTINIKL